MKLLLISDFNIETVASLLRNCSELGNCVVEVAPFGQVVAPLLNPPNGPNDFAVVWTSANKIVPTFGKALSFEAFSEDKVLSEVVDFAECLKSAATKFRGLFVASWAVPVYYRGYGMVDLNQRGIRNLLMKMNLRLVECLENVSGVYVLDSHKWMEAVGRNSYSPKLWYLTKSPFHPDVFKEAARDIQVAISAVTGHSKKLIVVDLDNTLWGGTLGDLGWEHLRLGGHDYVGEAFVDFQKALKGLSNRGILLAIASKNDEAIALEALSKHPEMVLRPADFVGWRISWSDKAANIANLVADLNLGLQSVVFVDDNPAERGRVREALPEVHVPEWPNDPTLFASHLLQMECFDSPHVSCEDRSRTSLYAADKERKRLKDSINSEEEWIKTLDTEITVETVNEVNRGRVIQLLNKVNQMNLRTRRASERELLDWLMGGNRKLWVLRVSDRFGDSGLSGILGLAIEDRKAHISDFVLSCRVMGRNVERAMVAVAAEYCHALGLEELIATYIPSAKNKPCFEFWKNSGFHYSKGNNQFSWRLDKPYHYPEGIKVTSHLANSADGLAKYCGEPAEGFQAATST